MKKILPLAVFLACVFLICIYVRRHLADFYVITRISIPCVLLIACGFLACLVINGLFVKVLTVGFGVDMHFLEYFSLSVMTSFGNLFLPMRGGAGIKAVYLKSRHGFDYSYFLSTLGANYLVVFNISSVTALACLAILYARDAIFSLPVALVFLAVAVMTSWGILLPAPGFEWIPVVWVRERAGQVMSGWRIIRKDRKTVVRLYCLAAVNLLTGFIVTWLEFGAFYMHDAHGHGIGILQAAIFSAVGGLSLFISVTPSALGIRETLLMFCSKFLGISPAQALAVSLLDRSINAVLICVLFCFASIHINRKLGSEGVGNVAHAKR